MRLAQPRSGARSRAALELHVCHRLDRSSCVCRWCVGQVKLHKIYEVACFCSCAKSVFCETSSCSRGYGWAICKYLAEAGAKVLVGTWPPAMKVDFIELQLTKSSKILTARMGSHLCGNSPGQMDTERTNLPPADASLRFKRYHRANGSSALPGRRRRSEGREERL